MRVALAAAAIFVIGWFLLARSGDAQAVSACLEKAGAEVHESPRFVQVFPYAIAVRSLDRVESYPELEGARFYFILYGSDRAMLFVGKGAAEAEAFETTLRTLLAEEGVAFSGRRAGNALLVREHEASWPSLDACLD